MMKLLLTIGALACLVGSVMSQEPMSMAGGTYCEIIWGPSPNKLTVSWNGTGGTCPESPGFFNVTTEDVVSTHGAANATIVVWNGIREWTLDAFIAQEGAPGETSDGGNSTDGLQEVYEYGTNIFPDGSGLIMVKQAELALAGGAAGRYSNNMVARYQTAFWAAGTTVYELVAPNCSAVYVMQSIFFGRPGNEGVARGQDLTRLVEDGVINPPEGWTYRVRQLDNDLFIYGVDGVTPVLSDDAGNSYSSMDQPLDPTVCSDDGEDSGSPTPAPTPSPTDSALSREISILVTISSIILVITFYS